MPGCTLDQNFSNVTVRVFAPGQPYDSQGGLSFCTSGQTRTITIPGIPFLDPNYCNWHHKYDWIVPSGWTVVPADGTSYVSIPGGIRTFAKTVNITSQSSGMFSGFGEHYVIRVRTEAAWPWPAESTRQIWVGTYGTSMTISGTSGVCPGNIYTFTVTPPGGHIAPGHTYQWTKPANWSIQSQGADYFTVYVPQYDPNYGPVQVSTNNGCGDASNGITAYPGYNCGGYAMSPYPNPADKELFINTGDGESQKEVILTNTQQEKIIEIFTNEKTILLPVGSLKEGTYYLRVISGGEQFEHRILIKH